MDMKRYRPLFLAAAAVVVGVTVWLSPRSLPLLLLVLVCPAMMFFMMRGMHHGAGDQSQGHQGCREHEEHPDDAEVMPK